MTNVTEDYVILPDGGIAWGPDLAAAAEMEHTNMTANNIEVRTKTARVAWTARCKSGYEYRGRTCQRATRRGALLCDECLHAEVIPAVAHASLLARVAAAVVALFTA
jgi:hypothetical protein